MSDLDLNLKNARRLETAIANTVSTIETNVLRGSMSVSIYDDEPANVVATNVSLVKEGISDIAELIRMRYIIRDAISRANHDSGLNTLMAAERVANDEAHVMQNLLERSQQMDAPDIERVVRKLEARKAGKVEAGYMSSGENISLTAPMESQTIQHLKTHVASLKRRKTEIVDKCAALNVTTTVTLTGLNTDLLQKYDLL